MAYKNKFLLRLKKMDPINVWIWYETMKLLCCSNGITLFMKHATNLCYQFPLSLVLLICMSQLFYDNYVVNYH